MAGERGRRAAVLASAAGLLVLLAAGFAFRARILEVHEHRNLPLLTADGRQVLLALESGFWAVDLETGRQRRLFELEGAYLRDACAAADGRRVVFRAFEESTSELRGIYLVELELEPEARENAR